MVPNQKSRFGGWPGQADDLGRAVLGDHRARAAPRATIPTIVTIPKHDFGFVSSRRAHSGARSRRARSVGQRKRDRVDDGHDLARAHARVEDDVEEVHDQVRGEDADGEDEQQRLRERIVGAERGLLEGQADARIAEDELDEDEAADGGAELRRRSR